ncbi:MAG: elongation factor [Paraburkholderia sp.]|jgi:elongation factor G|nr:elongation factor [Paraburkholderia sp.]
MEGAFSIAGRKAFIEAVMKAQPIVLEPIGHIEVTAPEAAIGDIGDLSVNHQSLGGSHDELAQQRTHLT